MSEKAAVDEAILYFNQSLLLLLDIHEEEHEDTATSYSIFCLAFENVTQYFYESIVLSL